MDCVISAVMSFVAFIWGDIPGFVFVIYGEMPA
jgi:hypothetical protein